MDKSMVVAKLQDRTKSPKLDLCKLTIISTIFVLGQRIFFPHYNVVILMIIFLEVTELGDIPKNHLVGGKNFCHHTQHAKLFLSNQMNDTFL